MSAITAGIYGGDPLYSGGDAVIDDLRASGFTTVVAFAIHVAENGDLVFNETAIVSAGEYVGDPAWPGQLSRLKQDQPTSVNRLLFCIGGWDTSDFSRVQAFIKEYGPTPDSPLGRSFQALKSAIPAIDGIDFDDESVYDPNTTVPFAQMLNGLGFEVTFCPYTNMDFWVGCLQKLNGSIPNLVTGFNLQCYAGGEGQTPGPWIDAIKKAMGPDFDAQGFVSPGLWCRNGAPACDQGRCPSDVYAQINEWSPTGIQSGWIWEFDDLLACESSGTCSGDTMGTADYAQAIVNALS